MSEVRINAELRSEFGKGAARRTRRAGKIPAVLYGHGTDPRHISLPYREYDHALKTDAGLNVLLELQVDGGRELALTKSIQRNPVRGQIEHVDLLLVRRGETVTVDVAVATVGAVSSDGLLDVQLNTITVEAEATAIPQSIEVSVEGLPVGAAIHAKDVPLPAGAELKTDPEAVVVHVLAAPTAAQVEADLAGAEAELGAGATGAAEQAAAKAEAEGAGESPEPTGEGDVVADTDSGEGGPPEPAE